MSRKPTLPRYDRSLSSTPFMLTAAEKLFHLTLNFSQFQKLSSPSAKSLDATFLAAMLFPGNTGAASSEMSG